jgi:hypothetical protein
MKVRILYRDSIRLRFFLERLPHELQVSVDNDKYKLWEFAHKKRKGIGAGPIYEKFFQAEDRVYSVKFALGKTQQDAPEEEPVQDLLILSIEVIPGVHGIK